MMGQLWFPNKSVIDQFLYICILAVYFLLSVDLGTSDTFYVLFSIPFPYSYQPLWYSPF
jgi:hypothetical protein